MSFYHVVLPVAGTNLAANPSLEYDATGWAGTDSATPLRWPGTAQYGGWGINGFGFTNAQAGVTYGTIPVSLGSYTVSVSMIGPVGSVYSIGMKGTGAGAAFVGSVAGTTGGTWHRYSFSYGESGAQQRLFAVVKRSGGNIGPIIDGLQIERGTFQTTYMDGDQEGCIWTGAPHASTTLRSGTARQGGTVVPLQSLGLTVLEHGGVGMPPVSNIMQDYAIADGALWQRQRAEARVLTLTGLMSGTTWQGLHAIRSGIVDALKIDRTANPQPVRLLYTGAGGTAAIDAYYDGGMTFESRSGFTETTAVRLLAPDPYWYATTDTGTALAPQNVMNLAALTSPLLQRAPTGAWGTLGGQMLNGIDAVLVYSLFYAPTGTLFVGGRFQTVAGTAAPNVAMWLPTTQAWGSLTGGTLGTTASREGALAFAWKPGGTLFVGGDFGPIAGTAQRYLAQWTGVWGTLGPGTVNTPVKALAYNPEGTLFAGGTHTNVAGTTTYGVGQWTGAWGSLTGGTLGGAAPNVQALLWGADSALYAAGSFSNVAGTAAHGLGRWNGAWGTFGSVSAGVNTAAYALGQDANGLIYVGGNFGSVNSTPARNIAQWNGAQWQALSSGLGTAGDIVFDAVPTSGALLAFGNFGTAGGIPIPGGAAQWNRSAWLPNDVFFTASGARINAATEAPDRTLYIGGNFGGGSAIAAAVTTIINSASAIAYPVVTIRNTGTASSRITQLVNYATGDAIYFNLIAQGGETITLESYLAELMVP